MRDLAMQGPRDLYELLLGDRKRADRRIRSERRAQTFQYRPAAIPHRGPIDAAAGPAALITQVNVFSHRQVRRKRQLLVDDGDAVAPAPQSDR